MLLCLAPGYPSRSLLREFISQAFILALLEPRSALANAGLKVAHVDPNPYYGGCEATLTLDELIQWAEKHSTTTGDPEAVQYRIDYLSPNRPSHQKQYSISLSPTVIPSVGPFISSLISSGVARYGSYKLLGPAAIYRNGGFQSVPQNKEAIFQARDIPLIEKRRLMRFLAFAAGEFEQSPELQGKEDTPFDRFLQESFGLSEEISQVIMFALAYCNFSGGEAKTYLPHICSFNCIDSALTALHRVRSCLRSVGRYGPSPFLVGYYGGSGEITQGFCRATAVNGGVYILGRNISSFVVHDAQESERYSIQLEDIPDALRSSCILSSMVHVPHCLRSQANLIPPGLAEPLATRSRVRAVARCIAIVDGPITCPCSCGTDDISPVEGRSDSLLVIFPPGALDNGSETSCVTLLTAGAGTMSAPSDKSMAFTVLLESLTQYETDILYLSMPFNGDSKSSKEHLHPYLTQILDLNPTCQLVFEVFYVQYFIIAPDELHQDSGSNLFVLPYLQLDCFQTVDQAAHDAENAFQSVVQGLHKNVDYDMGLWTHQSLVVHDQ